MHHYVNHVVIEKFCTSSVVNVDFIMISTPWSQAVNIKRQCANITDPFLCKLNMQERRVVLHVAGHLSIAGWVALKRNLRHKLRVYPQLQAQLHHWFMYILLHFPFLIHGFIFWNHKAAKTKNPRSSGQKDEKCARKYLQEILVPSSAYISMVSFISAPLEATLCWLLIMLKEWD